MFFGYSRCYSVTLMLSELNLPNFDSSYANCVLMHYSSRLTSGNVLIINLTSLQLITKAH